MGDKMKVVVVSDSHGRKNILEEITIIEKDADCFIHCGDLEVDPSNVERLGYICVRGNNDYFSGLDEMREINLNGIRTLILHGQQAGYLKRDAMLAKITKTRKCQLALFGHWHVPNDSFVDGIRLINPGALHRPRCEFRGYAVLNIKDDNIANIEVEYKTI